MVRDEGFLKSNIILLVHRRLKLTVRRNKALFCDGGSYSFTDNMLSSIFNLKAKEQKLRVELNKLKC